MASPGKDTGPNTHSDHQEPTELTPEPAFQEAQKWIEAVTGRSFGDKDFRNGLENGILLCELLSSIKPGLVKKINRLPTPIAGLDNLTMFLRGCEELGLKGSQLFGPGDLQDTSVRANLTGSDCSRKLKNVLITIYWLGKTANSCASYNGPTLDLKEFEGLLSMMRKKECVSEESDSPKRSVRDSGYIDNWESERSESLSPPGHGREDSFDSLDSFGSRSQQTPSPDTVLRGNSDDSEGDSGPRRLPDVRKDDMSARRVSYKEPRAARPFNQYLPNKSNQTNYIPAPLRKRRSDQEEERWSTSNATSPVGGERPLREECVGVSREGAVSPRSQKAHVWAATQVAESEINEEELKKMRKLEKAGIKVLPASVRYKSPKLIGGHPEEAKPPSPDIILRQDNAFLRTEQLQQQDDEDKHDDRKVPDIRKDDLASRRVHTNQSRPTVAHHFLSGVCSRKDHERWEGIRLASQHAVLEQMEKMHQDKRSEADSTTTEVSIITRKDNPFLTPRRKKRGEEEESEEEGGGQVLVPNPQKDDLARRRTQSGTLPQRDPRQSLAQTSITQSDLEKWQRLSMNTEDSDSPPVPLCQACLEKGSFLAASLAKVARGIVTDRRGPSYSERRRFVTFGGVTEMESTSWREEKEAEEEKGWGAGERDESEVLQCLLSTATVAMPTVGMNSGQAEKAVGSGGTDYAPTPGLPSDSLQPLTPNPKGPLTQMERKALEDRLAEKAKDERKREEEEEEEEQERQPDLEKDDMMARRTGAFQRASGGKVHNRFLPVPGGKRDPDPLAGPAPLESSQPGSGVATDPLMLEKRIKTKRFKVGQSGKYLSFTPSPVTAPSADVENMTRKCAQMMESQEAGTMGVKGGENEIVGGAQAYSPPLIRAPNPQCTFFLADDDLPQIFSHKAASVSDETESISLIDMRDEEEADPLSSHSQSRHESMHNQYNKLREEEEHWQDDLARWKNRRRCASQDLIRKEEERKMMEKLMYSEGGAHRRKSIKTYKEIVEEKERREQELHELYCKASTPEEKATVLQRYALRFTISDAILEKLQLPKLPSVATAVPALPQDTYTLSEKVEVLGPPVSTQSQKQLFAQPHMPMTQSSTHSRPKTPELSPSRRHNAPEVPVSLTWVPPPPSKPVPLLTPKPYCQPKFNQVSYKQVKTDGLVRMNGECNVEVTRESSLGATPSPIEALSHSPHSRPEISPASEDMAQKLTKTLPTQQLPVATSQETELAKEEREGSASPQERVDEEETPTAHADSQLAAGKQVVPSSMKCSSVIKTTIVTELTQTHPLPTTDMPNIDKDQKSHDELSSSDSGKADVNSCSLSLTESSHTSSSSRLRWEFFAPTEGLDFTSECIETPILNLAKRLDHWTWDPNEERKRQERWQQEQERLLQEKYQQEQERLKQEWEKAQKEVEEEGRRHYEEEQRILEETTSPLTPRSSALSLPSVTEALPLSVTLHDIAAPSPADQDRKPELLNKQTVMGEKNGLQHSSDQTEAIIPVQHNGQGADHQESQSATPQLQFIQGSIPFCLHSPTNRSTHTHTNLSFTDESWSCKSECRPEWKKTASLDRNMSPSQTQPPRMRRIGSYENILGMHPSKSLQSPQDTPPTSTSRSVSGKKLCSSCAQPLGKGAAMIIETLGLYFHTQCFKCGVCKGLLGETSAGTDVRIRNGVLSCQDCYIKSRAAGQPT
ncbi:hypothetical protein P4O66_012518, partial [Electrophorus voltai]